MAGEEAEVAHIRLAVVRGPVPVATDASLPDGHGVGHTATAGPHHVDVVARTVVQGSTTVGVLADDHAVPQGGVMTSLVSQILSYGQWLPK